MSTADGRLRVLQTNCGVTERVATSLRATENLVEQTIHRQLAICVQCIGCKRRCCLSAKSRRHVRLTACAGPCGAIAAEQSECLHLAGRWKTQHCKPNISSSRFPCRASPGSGAVAWVRQLVDLYVGRRVEGPVEQFEINRASVGESAGDGEPSYAHQTSPTRKFRAGRFLEVVPLTMFDITQAETE